MNGIVQKIFKTQKATVKDTREYFSDVLGIVHYGQKEVTIEKNGEPFAVLIDPSVLEEYKRLLNEKFYQTIQELWEENKDFSVEEIERDIEEARNEVYQMTHGNQK